MSLKKKLKILLHNLHLDKIGIAALLPLSWIIYGVSIIRKKWMLAHSLQTFPVPIIIVGNLTVGGSGKTPFVCALVEALKKRGYRPGVVSRGYKAKKSSSIPYAYTNSHTDTAENFGDEPLLIAHKTQVPVVICKNRPKAVEYLINHNPDINIVISDDGLQHYRLHRDIEIVLQNDITNPFLFPAGPFREPLSRLQSVDFVIKNSNKFQKLKQSITLLNHSDIIKLLTDFKDQPVYALAGIAHPHRFFKCLRDNNIKIIESRDFPDHYQYKQSDFEQLLAYSKQYPVLMTEKDAVKFKKWDKWPIQNIWVVALETEISDDLVDDLIRKIRLRLKTTA